MSDRSTPETDAARRDLSDYGSPVLCSWGDWVDADFACKLERERDEAREELGKTIQGVIDGGDTKEGYLMVQVPVAPTGFRVGQVVRVLLPEKKDAK